jgi:hypothetical protein
MIYFGGKDRGILLRLCFLLSEKAFCEIITKKVLHAYGVSQKDVKLSLHVSI